MNYSNLPANSVVDLAIINKFSARTTETAGYLNPFSHNGRNTILNAFESISLPESSFEIEPYIEAGWNSPKQINSGYVEWSELTLSRGFINPVKGNPTYDIFFNTRYGYKYRMNFIVYIYDLASVVPGKYDTFLKGLEGANRIIYAVIKGATPSNIGLITELDSGGSDINVSEATFSIEDMFLGVYDARS